MNEIRRLLTNATTRRNSTFSDIARRTGQSPQNLNGKLTRGTLSAKELFAIASILDADLVFIDRQTGERMI